MRHPERVPDPEPEFDPETARALARLAWSWMRVVAGANFVPGPPGQARAGLQKLLARLVRALFAEPFDPTCGYRVGVDLVAARMSSPHVLGETVTLLSRDLLPAIGLSDGTGSARLAELLGQLCDGFATTSNDIAVTAAESITRAEQATARRTERALQAKLQHTLLHDPLTGLPNREHLCGRLNDDLRPERLGVGLVGLDSFKAFNDSYGYDKGDELIRMLARRLHSTTARHGYFLAHLGADEFALLIPDTVGIDSVTKAVDQVLRALPHPLTLDGPRLPVTVKAGVVEAHGHGTDATELLRSASIALGWAKADGQTTIAVFDPQRGDDDVRRHQLTAAIPAALTNHEFALHYQPLVALADRAIIGVEALVRWHHPDHGLLAPDKFITLAEHSGYIQPLDLHLLETACRQGAAWRHDRHQLTISVNITPTTLTQPELTAAVAAILDHTGLPPAYLQLEITESTALDAHDHTLRQLVHLGIQLAIDDFGTGYSSLAYLTELPVHNVKLAARFLRNAGSDRGIDRVLPHVIAMCHANGIRITAEGIETADQAHHLAALGCDIGQGYHFARPAPADEITHLLHHAADNTQQP
jgi:diguanylate cyclase (GGDEF)-like protein